MSTAHLRTTASPPRLPQLHSHSTFAISLQCGVVDESGWWCDSAEHALRCAVHSSLSCGLQYSDFTYLLPEIGKCALVTAPGLCRLSVASAVQALPDAAPASC